MRCGGRRVEPVAARSPVRSFAAAACSPLLFSLAFARESAPAGRYASNARSAATSVSHSASVPTVMRRC